MKSEKMNEKGQQKKKGNGGKKKAAIFSLVIVAVVLAVIYLSIAVYFQYHFFKGTVIGDMDCSFESADTVNDKYKNQGRTYYLEIIERNGEVEHISAEDIKLTVGTEFDAKELLDKQNSYGWIFNINKEHIYSADMSVSYDKNALNARYMTLNCLNEEKMTDPKPPEISYENNVYTIGKLNPGTRLDIAKTKECIEDAIASMKASIDLEELGCYTESADNGSSKYDALVNTLNKYVNAKITLTFNNELEDIIIDSSKITKWISVNEKLEIVFDREAIEAFVGTIARDIETMGQSRHFLNSYGNEISISGGDYGWWVAKGKEADAIINDIKNGEAVTRELNYLQRAASFGESDLGDTYIEINLMKQHLFCYKEGELITECDIISGTNASPTPTGIYRMRFMFKNYTFKRDYFNRTVAYWMVFYGDSPDTNIGLISCDWREDFGGTTYLYSGTHGSLFVPLQNAKLIYEQIPNDIPVIIYQTY